MQEQAIHRAGVAEALARGIGRYYTALGYTPLTEFHLPTGRRVDVVALGRKAEIHVVEIKSSREDFRVDGKWPEYREFCDRFLFAVPLGFPVDLIPEDCGLLIADAYGAELVREAPEHPLPGARRRAQLIRIAQVAGQRLLRFTDPEAP